MAAQLDILALEPFYGGGRRAMLQVLRKCSRHRWTLLKLPPRRMERRLTSAANWFAEQLIRHFSGNIDLIFASEAMNLARLLRLVPELASKPSVVYFHDNHLPDPGSLQDGPFDLVNLETAMAAGEIWFNSHYHHRSFLERAAALVARHPELTTRDPMPAIFEKAHVLSPPMDLKMAADLRNEDEPPRRQNAIFAETRDADVKLLNAALEILVERRQFELVTVGPIDGLSDRWPRSTIREDDDLGQVRGMLEASVFLSAKSDVNWDYLFSLAMFAGCLPVVPTGGAYPELLPESLRPASLYASTADALANALCTALDGAADWRSHPPDWSAIFATFDAIPACKKIDRRLEQLTLAAAELQATPPPYVR
jgi:hypothetical protein